MKRNSRRNIIANVVFGICLSSLIIPGKTFAATPEKETSLESRLQRLEDNEEIRLLLKSYGQFLDKRDFDSLSKLFSEKEGEWDGGMGKAKGWGAIRKLMEDAIGTNTEKGSPPNYHIFTNEMIDVKGDQATALSKWIFVVLGDGSRPQVMLLGHYEDSLVRENGRWRFLRRKAYTDMPTENQMKR